MRPRIIFVAGILMPALLHGQSWQWSEHIGGEGIDEAWIGHLDAQGNTYLYGNYARPFAFNEYYDMVIDGDTLEGNRDAFLAKYDAEGNLLWARNCVSPAGIMTIYSFFMDTLSDAFFITGGYMQSCNIDTVELNTPGWAGFLAKLNTDGHCFWAENITASATGSSGTAVTTDGGGNIYLAGLTAEFGNTLVGSVTLPPGSFLAKYEPDGDQVWAKTLCAYGFLESALFVINLRVFGSDLYGYGAMYLNTTSDILTVDTINFTGLHGSGHVLMKVDPSTGVASWVNLEGLPGGGAHLSLPHRMDMDEEGNFYCASNFLDSASFGGDTLLLGGYGSYCGKFNAAGELQWIHQFNGGLNITAIDQLADGTILIAATFSGVLDFGGCTVISDSAEGMILARIDSSGACLGFDQVGNGAASSVRGNADEVFVSGIFPPAPTTAVPESVALGNDTYTSHGWVDTFLAKRDLITGIGSFRNEANDALVIYANPNKGSFRLVLPDAFMHERQLVLSIFDSSGRMIRHQGLDMEEGHPKLEIHGVSAGLYSVSLSNGQRSYHGSMVVE